MITVYHGTAYGLTPLIQQEGIIPLDAKHPFVYVTTEEHIARDYASSWVTGSIYNFEQKKFIHVDTGAILKLELDESLLLVDDYDLVREPHQYKINGVITPSAIISVDRIEECDENLVERILHVEPDVFDKIKDHWIE